MSLLCFSMNFSLSDDETAETMALTTAAYDAWVLVNDYFPGIRSGRIIKRTEVRA